MKSPQPPLPLGTQVEPWGTVGAVMTNGGERYYMLTDRYGVVSLMPATDVERNAESELDSHLTEGDGNVRK